MRISIRHAEKSMHNWKLENKKKFIQNKIQNFIKNRYKQLLVDMHLYIVQYH